MVKFKPAEVVYTFLLSSIVVAENVFATTEFTTMDTTGFQGGIFPTLDSDFYQQAEDFSNTPQFSSDDNQIFLKPPNVNFDQQFHASIKITAPPEDFLNDSEPVMQGLGRSGPKNLASFENPSGETFALESNTTPGQCLTLQNFFGTYVVDPVSKKLKFVPVAYLTTCDSRNLAQQFAYNKFGQLVANRRCLAPLATSDTESYPSGDPCSTHATLDYAGSILFSDTCDHTGQSIHQKWKIGRGVVQSQCPHAFWLSHDTRYFAVSGVDNYAGLTISRFGFETTVDGNFASTPAAVLREFIIPKLFSALIEHGCWCSKFNDLIQYEWAGGPIVVDELDNLCKSWARARKCNKAPTFGCHENKHGYEGYTFSIDLATYPWTMEGVRKVTCGQTFNHLNKSKCSRETCLIDTHFAKKIANFLHANQDFGFLFGDEQVCRKSVKEQSTEDNNDRLFYDGKDDLNRPLTPKPVSKQEAACGGKFPELSPNK